MTLQTLMLLNNIALNHLSSHFKVTEVGSGRALSQAPKAKVLFGRNDRP
jgi:hypothetical protein